MLYTIQIKNMVCNRCIKVVSEELEKLNIKIEEIQLGQVSLVAPLSASKLQEVDKVLSRNGFELLNDKKQQTIDKIKTYIIEIIHYQKEIIPETKRFSKLIAEHVAYDYSYLSHLFSTKEGITIEKYIIAQKAERIKELLSYNELSIKEIAYQMNYSSAQHLSKQFKSVTGMSPSKFKKNTNERQSLDQI